MFSLLLKCDLPISAMSAKKVIGLADFFTKKRHFYFTYNNAFTEPSRFRKRIQKASDFGTY